MLAYQGIWTGGGTSCPSKTTPVRAETYVSRMAVFKEWAVLQSVVTTHTAEMQTEGRTADFQSREKSLVTVAAWRQETRPIRLRKECSGPYSRRQNFHCSCQTFQ